MMDGVPANNEGRADPDEFGRKVRQLALDAHRILKCPDSPIDELFDLHWRSWSLLHEAPGEQTDGVYRWLLAARRAIVDRLHHWATDELESSVA